MSRDIFVQELPKGTTDIADIPDEFEPGPLGSRSDLIRRICALFPEADFTDPTWGAIEGPDFSIEVNLGDDDPVVSFALHVRGGDSAPFAVARLLAGLGVGGLDPQNDTGIFALDDGSVEGFEKWRQFRDQAIGRGGA